MMKPKIEEFNLKSFKMLNQGGAHIEYTYRYSVNNEAHQDSVKLDRTAEVHGDLYGILQKQAGNIMRIEEINYRAMITQAKEYGLNNLKELSQIAEGLTAQSIQTLKVTGFRISGEDNKRQVIITYKKKLHNGVVGRATTNIKLSGNQYGIEEELESDINDFKSEVYGYLFHGKYNDSEQLAFDFEMEEKDIEIEAEEVANDMQ